MQKQLLDHGYVKFVESWGSDERIIESARMSTDGAFRGWGTPEAPGDEKLLCYLYSHKHDSPFEFAGMVIEVQAPIFVFREWQRHRTQSFNEMSGRYTELPNLAYVPSVERLMLRDKSNKQAGGVAGKRAPTEHAVLRSQDRIRVSNMRAQGDYRDLLMSGVTKELARIVLPVGRYSRMRASANLRNWLGFLTLRQAKEAQWEIRQYADAVGEFIALSFPRTWELFSEKRAT